MVAAGRHGRLLFQIKYTALPHALFCSTPSFLVAGWMSALLGCDIGIVLWALKAVGVALFLSRSSNTPIILG